MRFLIDMDDVIASWGDEYDLCLSERGEPALGIPRKHDRSTWDLRHGRTPEEREIIESIMVEPGFYARLRGIPGARTALRQLVKDGHDVRILTAPYVSNPTCASDKINWIAHHYGSHWAQRVILTTDKTVVRGDVLIDDRPDITGSMTPEWRHIVFGDYAYNRHLVGRPRLHSWGDLDDVYAAAFLATGVDR